MFRDFVLTAAVQVPVWGPFLGVILSLSHPVCCRINNNVNILQLEIVPLKLSGGITLTNVSIFTLK